MYVYLFDMYIKNSLRVRVLVCVKVCARVGWPYTVGPRIKANNKTHRRAFYIDIQIYIFYFMSKGLLHKTRFRQGLDLTVLRRGGAGRRPSLRHSLWLCICRVGGGLTAATQAAKLPQFSTPKSKKKYR